MSNSFYLSQFNSLVFPVCVRTNISQRTIGAVVLVLFSFAPLRGQYIMENINRGVVAIRISSTQVYIGWRMYGKDPADISFNVYRGATKINATPVVNATNYIDNVASNHTYTIRPVVNGAELGASEAVNVWMEQYLQIPLDIPTSGTTPDGVAYTYHPNDCSVGDVDGDGQYEIIVKWDPSNAKDNSQSGYTGNVFLDAYTLSGMRLWRIDLGRNIRAGAHYTQFMVYDLDSDGRAEVACKTADGTIDGQGIVIGDANADHRNAAGYVLAGPEFLTVFEGTTGRALSTVEYIVPRGVVSSWGDSYGNRVDRFVNAIAYLDGQHPSLIAGRGYYTRMVRAAWDFREGQLIHRWTFDDNATYAGQGNHQMTVGDTDEDGRQEIFNGSSTINDDGTGLWVNGKGHGDALHMSDMDPDRPGLELWMPYECMSCSGNIGAALIDGATGSVLWSRPGTGDVGRAMAADIDASHKGYEVWAAGSTGGVFNIQGTQISATRPSINFGIWWDGDLQRELLDGITISKWQPSMGSATALLTASACASNNGTKATPALTADLFGDWREEVIWRTADNQFLRLYTTIIPTDTRIYTLMHDPQYRMGVAWQNSAYNQPPHPGFYLGGGMQAPPQPNIVLAGACNPVAGSVIIEEGTAGFCNVDGTIDTDHTGFSGAGFANSLQRSGAGITWNVSTERGAYTLIWRYANGSGSNRPAQVLINDTLVANIDFPITRNWNTWTETATMITLDAGTHVMRLEAANSGGLSNIDYVQISGACLPAGIPCEPGGRLASQASADLLSLDDEETVAVVAMPNPISDGVVEIQADLADDTDAAIIIADLSGKRISIEHVPGHASGKLIHPVDISHLAPGIYVVAVHTRGKVYFTKLVRQ